MIENNGRRNKISKVIREIQNFEEKMDTLNEMVEDVEYEETAYVKKTKGLSDEKIKNAKYAIKELKNAKKEMMELQKQLMEVIAILTFALEGENL